MTENEQEERQARDPLLDTWEKAWNEHDLDAIMTLFTPNAVVTVVPPPPGEPSRYNGKAAIQRWIEPLFAEKSHIGTRDHQVQGDTVTCMVTLSGGRLLRQGLDPLAFAIEAVVQLDKITAITASLPAETAAKLKGR
jgi:ketosteroid isomerase-like protein